MHSYNTHALTLTSIPSASNVSRIYHRLLTQYCSLNPGTSLVTPIAVHQWRSAPDPLSLFPLIHPLIASTHTRQPGPSAHRFVHFSHLQTVHHRPLDLLFIQNCCCCRYQYEARACRQ
eukprot:scpid8630/ scgid26580/ 